MNHCPGPGTESAGTAEGCKGCPNAGICSSAKPDPDVQLISERLKNIKVIIAVLSGKGGVGKSTISTGIANSLSKMRLTTLLLDWDFSGPSIPRMTSTMHEGIRCKDSDGSCRDNSAYFGGDSDASFDDESYEFEPTKATEFLRVLSISNFEVFGGELSFYNSSTKNKVAKDMLKRCNFQGVDAIVIDTPPNITEEHLIIANYLRISSGVIVTTPQSLSFNDVKRQISFCKKTGIPIGGVIENMKDFMCTGCGHSIAIFNKTPIRDYCNANHLEYLGSLPLKTEIARNADDGKLANSDFFDQIARSLLAKCNCKEPINACTESINT